MPVKKSIDPKKEEEEGWFRPDNHLVLDLMESGGHFKNIHGVEFDQVYISCSSKSNQDDTLDELHHARKLKKYEESKMHYALKRVDLDEPRQMSQKQHSLFARPKAIS